MNNYSNLSRRVKKGNRKAFSEYLYSHSGVLVRARTGEYDFELLNMMTFHRDYEKPNWDTEGMAKA